MASGRDLFGVGAILDGKKTAEEEEDYFKILGCTENSNDEQILAEFRVRALQCHPDKHPGDKGALEKFQKLQEAKDTLLDPEKRLKYDRWRNSEMCIPYKQWLAMSNRCVTTMHWAKPREQTMLESGADSKRSELEKKVNEVEVTNCTSSRGAEVRWSSATESQRRVWRPQDTTGVYAKFRDYKI